MLSTLHAGVLLSPRICPLCTQPHSHPAAPPVLSGSFCWMLGGPRSAHANAHLCSREHTFSASRAAGGEPPLLKVHSGVIHPRTNSAARAAGGEPPLLEVHSGVIHPRTNSAARAAGGESPLPGCTHAPRASGDTRLDSRACLTPRTPHIYKPSVPLPLAPHSSGPMADREVKRTAHVRGLSEERFFKTDAHGLFF